MRPPSRLKEGGVGGGWKCERELLLRGSLMYETVCFVFCVVMKSVRQISVLQKLKFHCPPTTRAMKPLQLPYLLVLIAGRQCQVFLKVRYWYYAAVGSVQ